MPAEHNEFNEFLKAFNEAYSALAIESKHAQRLDLEQQVNAPDFWQTHAQDEAQQLSQELAQQSSFLDSWLEMRRDIDELAEFIELGDESLDSEIDSKLTQLRLRFDAKKEDLLFVGEHDDQAAIVTIQSGAGGLDAQDWASMLLRMYSRWAEKDDSLKLDIYSQSLGEEGGTKSATLRIGGTHAYGRMKSEHGVHRLVRLSPFNSANSRETSFAMVEVIPEISQSSLGDIPESDLRIDVYRAGGHGGQSVNTTDSAVRVTHIPTGVAVAIQNERSQTQNKEVALAILRSKLEALAEEQHQQAIDDLKGPNVEAAWGNQIRSYVLHPYTMVKDTRSNHQTSDVQAVLDGEIDDFQRAYLESQIGKSDS